MLGNSENQKSSDKQGVTIYPLLTSIRPKPTLQSWRLSVIPLLDTQWLSTVNLYIMIHKIRYVIASDLTASKFLARRSLQMTFPGISYTIEACDLAKNFYLIQPNPAPLILSFKGFKMYTLTRFP